jgi:hypothetical protein
MTVGDLRRAAAAPKARQVAWLAAQAHIAPAM